MNKKEFLKALQEQISVSKKEKENALQYYEEMIDEEVENGKNEEDVIASFGSINEIVSSLGEEEKKKISDDVYHCKHSINGIEIDARNLDIVIRNTKDTIMNIDYPNNNYDVFHFEEKDGILYINHQQRFHLFHPFMTKHTLLLELPDAILNRLFCKTSNATIKVEDIKQIKEAKFKTSNARIIMSHIQIDNSLALTTSNGAIEMESVQANMINAKTSNGHIHAYSCFGEKLLSCITCNGSIVFERIDAKNTYLESSNGKIKGVMSDVINHYFIKSRTSNGSNNLPNGLIFDSATKDLVVQTSNAAIKVDFVK